MKWSKELEKQDYIVAAFAGDIWDFFSLYTTRKIKFSIKDFFS